MGKTSIEWTDRSINPIRARDRKTGAVGHYCEMISAGCAHCYASRLQTRFKMPAFKGAKSLGPLPIGENGCVQISDQIELFLDESKLQEVLRRKTPTKWFWCDMTDLFGAWVPNEWIDRCFDAMWETPHHTHQVLTKRPKRAVQYMRERAYRREFGWTDLGRRPMRPGDHFHMDSFYGRNMCGYVGNGDWQCDHPKNESCGQDDSCHRYECPVAFNADDRESLVKIGVADQYKFDDEGVADDCEWMELHSRPLHARPASLWLGFSAENQQTFEERSRIFRVLRDDDPFLVMFASIEPLLGPINTRFKYWPENSDADGLWSPLETQEFSSGSIVKKVPYLNWSIVGGESGRDARPCNLNHIRSLVEQYGKADVPLFVKQLGSYSWGEWGDDSAPVSVIGKASGPNAWPFKDSKGGDPAEWPADLRVREFPRVEARP